MLAQEPNTFEEGMDSVAVEAFRLDSETAKQGLPVSRQATTSLLTAFNKRPFIVCGLEHGLTNAQLLDTTRDLR